MLRSQEVGLRAVNKNQRNSLQKYRVSMKWQTLGRKIFNI